MTYTSFSFAQRTNVLEQLTNHEQDVLIIGGGITGAGILLDAQSRGLQSCLLEMQDFAEGTSSRSTKLVHGGLRYLKQLDFKLVKEVGRERSIVFENGPHVTKSEPLLLPIVKGGSIGQMGALFGLWLYDMLAGVKENERRRIIHKASVLAMEPYICQENLKSGAYYYEYRTDDARLTIEILKAAVAKKASAINYCKVTKFLYHPDGKIKGVVATDLLTGKEVHIHSKVVINATGPWVDSTDALDNTTRKNKLLLSKGVHIVVDASRLPIGQAMYFDANAGRMVFAIPREGKVYIGTTETVYEEDITHPRISKADRDYLLQAVNDMFAGLDLKPSDVESGWAGLRPLIKQEGKKPGEVSRKDEIFEAPSGLLSIAGGKLTGYRKMAERIVNKVSVIFRKKYGRTIPECSTDAIKISGGDVGGSKGFMNFVQNKVNTLSVTNWDENDMRYIALRYGSNCDMIAAIGEQPPHYPSSLPSRRLAELEYAIQYEMCITPLDFFNRRTGALYFDIEAVEREKEAVTDYLAKRVNYSPEQKEKFYKDLMVELDSLRELRN